MQVAAIYLSISLILSSILHKVLQAMEHHTNTLQPKILPHVLLFPLPIQSPINSMLQLAELFCLAGLQVTFLNTEHNQKLLYRHTDIKLRFSQYPKFQFRTISDGLPEDHPRSSLTFGELISSLQAVAEPFLREMLTEPDVTCVIPDGLFYYAVYICNEVGVSVISFDTISPCCLWVYLCFPKLIDAGDIPFEGTSHFLDFFSLIKIQDKCLTLFLYLLLPFLY